MEIVCIKKKISKRKIIVISFKFCLIVLLTLFQMVKLNLNKIVIFLMKLILKKLVKNSAVDGFG